MQLRVRLPRFRFNLRHLLLGVALCAVLLAIVAGPVKRYAIKTGSLGWARLSPFTNVLCEESGRVRVEFEGELYELVSIERLPTEAILETCRAQFGVQWEKRFVEDLVEVLMLMGRSPREHVQLVLRKAGGEIKIVSNAPLTAENRQKAYDARYARLKPAP